VRPVGIDYKVIRSVTALRIIEAFIGMERVIRNPLAVMALEAFAVTVGVVGGVFGHGTGVVALAAGCGVHEAVVVTVDATGAVVRVMGGKLPLGDDIYSGAGGLPAVAFVTTDAG
jgi:hypothetical protein